MSHSYTKSTLMNNEKVVYIGRLHMFCYIPSAIVIFIGLLIFGLLPQIEIVSRHIDQETVEKVDDKVNVVKKRIGGAQRKLSKEVERVASLLPKEMQTAAKSAANNVVKIETYHFGVILIFFGFVNLLKNYLQKNASEFVVTTRKVIHKTGFISIHALEINLDRIEGVHVTQSVLDRMIHRGTVLINGIGVEQIKMLHISDPITFRKAVLEAIEKYSHKPH